MENPDNSNALWTRFTVNTKDVDEQCALKMVDAAVSGVRDRLQEIYSGPPRRVDVVIVTHQEELTDAGGNRLHTRDGGS